MTTLGELTDQQLIQELDLLDEVLLNLKKSRVEVTYLNVKETEESKSIAARTGKTVGCLGAVASGGGATVVISTWSQELMVSTEVLLGTGFTIAGAALVVPVVVLALMKRKKGSLLKRRDREIEEIISRLTIYRISCREILHRRAAGIHLDHLDEIPVSQDLPAPRP